MTRPNPNFTAQVLEITNLGWSNSNSLQFSLVKRYSRGYQYRVAYTLSDSFGNVAAPGNIETISTQVRDRPQSRGWRSADDAGPAARAVARRRGGGAEDGRVAVERRLPVSERHAVHADRQQHRSQPERPVRGALPAGSYSGAATNSDAITVVNDGGFRGARGPDRCLLSLRARYSFRLSGNRALQAWVDVFNVTNRANFRHADGDRRDTATFLILRSVTNPTRTAQLNLRFTF